MRPHIPTHRTTAIAVLTILSICMCIPVRAEPPRLTKKDAKRILEDQGYRDVSIVAVIHGVKMVGPGSDDSAAVLGVGRLNGELVKFDLDDKILLYDDDIGWFDYEFTGNSRLRIWTARTGYSENFAEKNSLSEAEIQKMLLGTWKRKDGADDTLTYFCNGTWQQRTSNQSAAGTWKLVDGNLQCTQQGGEGPYLVEIMAISPSEYACRVVVDGKAGPIRFRSK